MSTLEEQFMEEEAQMAVEEAEFTRWKAELARLWKEAQEEVKWKVEEEWRWKEEEARAEGEWKQKEEEEKRRVDKEWKWLCVSSSVLDTEVTCVLFGHIHNILIHLLLKAVYQLFLVFYRYCYSFSE